MPGASGSLKGCIGACKTLIRHHIPFGVTGSFAPLEGYRALLERFTGHRLVGHREATSTYFAPQAGLESLFGGFNSRYPLPFDGGAPLVETTDARVLATLTFPYTGPDEIRFASIHSDPPGQATNYPAVTVNSLGDGRVIWSALPLEEMAWPEYGQILLALLELPTPFFTADAPPHVELTAFRADDGILLHAVALDENTVTSDVAPFEISVEGEASAVTLLPEGTPVPFRTENGRTLFRTRTLHIFDTYRIS